MQFQIIDKNDEHFELNVSKANTVWIEAFGNEYGEGQCPGDSLAIGCIDGKIVCCAIIQIWNDIALISCMGSNPQKCGYGSSLMRHVVKHLKASNITKTYLKIDKDEKADRLEKFYSNFGFAKDEVGEEDVLFDYDPYLDLDVEYVMSCDLNLDLNLDLDLDLDFKNLQIVS
jgi:hypothetical protein